jgi:hypothetical protein
MKKLALLMLFIVVGGACGGSSGPPPPPPPAAFRASWAIDDEFGDPIFCADVPADTVTFEFDGRSTGDRPTFIFDCEQGLGVTVVSQADLLIGETYDVDVTLWFDYQGPQEQIVGTQPFVVTPQSTLFDFPTILFALQ